MNKHVSTDDEICDKVGCKTQLNIEVCPLI